MSTQSRNSNLGPLTPDEDGFAYSGVTPYNGAYVDWITDFTRKRMMAVIGEKHVWSFAREDQPNTPDPKTAENLLKAARELGYVVSAPSRELLVSEMEPVSTMPADEIERLFFEPMRGPVMLRAEKATVLRDGLIDGTLRYPHLGKTAIVLFARFVNNGLFSGKPPHANS
jgi:hypothetical protein